ncbi:hypothetical protein TNCV_544411 [Trichonephila clavipes]|nr:hypothetical protein TNCV_544411 [Trichonephila clavipes]
MLEDEQSNEGNIIPKNFIINNRTVLLAECPELVPKTVSGSLGTPEGDGRSTQHDGLEECMLGVDKGYQGSEQ